MPDQTPAANEFVALRSTLAEQVARLDAFVSAGAGGPLAVAKTILADALAQLQSDAPAIEAIVLPILIGDLKAVAMVTPNPIAKGLCELLAYTLGKLVPAAPPAA